MHMVIQLCKFVWISSKGVITLAIAVWIAIVIGDYFLTNQSKAVTD